MVTIKKWVEAEKEAFFIRYQVFVVEQKVPIELELDGLDDLGLHVLIYQDGKAVGTARLVFENSTEAIHAVGRIGRVSILQAYRGQGYARKLIQALIDSNDAQELREFYLHAQTSSVHLYKKMGFELEGDVFEEAGIKHQLMRFNRG